LSIEDLEGIASTILKKLESWAREKTSKAFGNR
jgi:hypothetical protein